jgi:hypothetical protein
MKAIKLAKSFVQYSVVMSYHKKVKGTFGDGRFCMQNDSIGLESNMFILLICSHSPLPSKNNPYKLKK